jgi:hypothetical protein
MTLIGPSVTSDPNSLLPNLQVHPSAHPTKFIFHHYPNLTPNSHLRRNLQNSPKPQTAMTLVTPSVTSDPNSLLPNLQVHPSAHPTKFIFHHYPNLTPNSHLRRNLQNSPKPQTAMTLATPSVTSDPNSLLPNLQVHPSAHPTKFIFHHYPNLTPNSHLRRNLQKIIP